MAEPGRAPGIDAIMAGVAPAMALRSGMELGLFAALGPERLTAADLAARLGVEATPLRRLLRALATAGVIEADGDSFRNGPEAARRLAVPGGEAAAQELSALIWRADLQTAASIRQGRPMAAHDFAAADPAETAAFLRGLAPGARAWGAMLGERIDLSAARSVIDIGGGPGTLMAGLRRRWPHLAGTVLDLPPVLAAAQPILAAEGLGDLVCDPGDIVAAPPTGRHDLAVLRAVIQCLGPAEAERAIRHAVAGLNPGGRIVIGGGGILDDDGAGPAAAVYLDLTLLNLYRDGASWPEQAYRGWLAAAGATAVERVRLLDGNSFFLGRAPG